MSKQGVKRSQRSFDILRYHSDAVLAGMALSSRDKNLAQARCVTDKGLRLMFVDFAKEAHREYLRCLKQIKLYDERRRKHVDCARRMQDNMHEESILTIQRLTNLCRNTGEWDFVRQWK